MTDVTSTVLPGPAVTIGANLPGGFTIRNQSTTTAIWVSGSASVTPGNGMKLSALGSLTWTGGPCYAILDTPTGSATLSISNTTTAVTDPVAVAQAVNALGIPSVLTGSMITGVIDGEPFDVSNFATVAGTINVPAAGYVVIEFFDPTQTATLYEKKYVFGAKYNGWQFTTPVYGPLMSIYYNGAGGGGANITPYLFGTNRVLPLSSISDVSINASLNQALTANTVYPVGPPIATVGGLASFNLRCTPAIVSAKGTYGFQYWSTNSGIPGALQSQTLCDTTQMHIDDSGTNSSIFLNNVLVPAGAIQPYYQPATAVASGIVVYTGMVP